MTQILDALTRGFRDLFQLKILWVVVWPVLVAVFLWLVLGLVFREPISGLFESGLAAIGFQSWLEGVEPRWIANVIHAVLHLMLFVPLVFATALVITALFAMPALIRLAADRDHSQLKRENGGGMIGSMLNALFAIGMFIAIWVITLPLWLIGIGVMMPFIAAAYLNQRLFRYDALAEHASREEMRALFTKHRASWWGLGLLTGFLQFIPLLNLFAPVLTALVFIHFGLARLTELRLQSG